MNKIHRVIWSDANQTWVAAAETTSSKGKPASRRKRLQAAVSVALMASSTLGYAEPPANTLPTGGNVVGGPAVATINPAGSNTLNINQTAGKAIINWNSFSIGSAATVNFIQPNSSAVTLNRVIGSDPSQIYGRMNANGQVFLINPNGVLFGKGARVDVGGLVASTLGIKDADFLSGTYRFSGNGGSVVNQGELLGNYIALLAPEVRNEGAIVARKGTVALAGSTGVTLNLVSNQLIDVMVDAADINTLIENKHLIQAEEGMVILSAQSANQLLGKVVNSGSIAAQGISTDGGKVRLTASSNIEHSGSINVDAGTSGKGGSAILIANLDNPDSRTDISGSISAKGGSQSGDGGFVETSGSHLKVASSAHIDTRALGGKTGQWLLDPTNFTVAAMGGDMTGTDLGNALNLSSVIIDTTGGTASCTGASCPGPFSGTDGDIFITDNVSWGPMSSSVLTLKAYRNIEIDGATITAPVAIPGNGGIEMLFGQKVSGTYTIKNGATISDGAFGAPVVIAPDGSPMSPAALGGMGDYTSSPTAFVRLDAGQSSTYGDVPSINYSVYLTPNGTGASDLPMGVGVHSGTDAVGSTGWETSAGACSPFTPSGCLLPITHAGTASYVYAGGVFDPNYYYIAGDAVNWTVDPRTLTVSLTNTDGQKTKTYDGNTNAPTGFAPTYSITGFASGDTAATLNNTGVAYTGASAQHAGAANSNELTVSGLSIAAGSIVGINGSLESDYTLAAPTVAADATINPIQLTASLNNAGTTKVYDGTTAAPGGFAPTYDITGSLLMGDSITTADINNTGAAYTNAHVAFVGNNITVSGLSIGSMTANGAGSVASDYVLTTTTASASATITPIALTLNAALGASGTTTKVYDGTTDAPSGFAPGYSMTGTPRTGDTVNLTGTAAYNDKDVLDANSIDVTGVQIASISGNSGSPSQTTDYSLTGSTASFSGAGITRADLTLTGSRTVDGTTIAAGSTLTANGVHGETFTVTGDGDTTNLLSGDVAGSPHTLNSLTNLALGSSTNGGDANNYTPLSTTGSQYTINAKVDTGSGTSKLVTTVQEVTKMTWKEAYKKVVDANTTGTGSSNFDQTNKKLKGSDEYLNAETVNLLLKNGWTAADFKKEGIPLSMLYTSTEIEEKEKVLDSSSYSPKSGLFQYSSSTLSYKAVHITSTTTLTAAFSREQLVAAGYSEDEIKGYLDTPTKTITSERDAQYETDTYYGKYSSSTNTKEITPEAFTKGMADNAAKNAAKEQEIKENQEKWATPQQNQQ